MLLEIDFGSIYFSNPVETVSCMSATNRCMHRYLFDTPCRLQTMKDCPTSFRLSLRLASPGHDRRRPYFGKQCRSQKASSSKGISRLLEFYVCWLLAVGTTMLLCKQRLNGKFSTLANRVLRRYIRMLKQLVFAHSSLSAVR